MLESVRKAAEIMGGVEKLAEALGCTRQALHQWDEVPRSRAAEIEIDAIGRMLIPEFLHEFADLKNTIVITGVHDRVEIWSALRWASYRKKLESEYA